MARKRRMSMREPRMKTRRSRRTKTTEESPARRARRPVMGRRMESEMDYEEEMPRRKRTSSDPFLESLR